MEKRFLTILSCKQWYYKEVIKWYESVGLVRDKSSTEIYCEDERLSLFSAGVRSSSG